MVQQWSILELGAAVWPADHIVAKIQQRKPKARWLISAECKNAAIEENKEREKTTKAIVKKVL